MQVVHHDQAQGATKLARHAASTRAQLCDGQARRFVDEHVDLAEFFDGLGQAPPLVVGQLARAQVLLVDAAQRTDHPQGQLRRTHFHGKHHHRQLFLDADVLRNVQRKGGLAHRRARRQHDEVAFLQTRGHAVQVVITGANASHVLGAVFRQFVDPVQQRHDQFVHALEALLLA